MFLANLSKRERILLYLAATFISLNLFYKFAIKPLLKKWDLLNQQILNSEIELKRSLKYLNLKDEVENIYLSYIGHIKKSGADEEELTVFLNEVEKVARASGMHIANIRPEPVKDLEFYKKYLLEMNCEATMENYIEFIYNLQKTAQLIRVEKLKLFSQGKANPLLKARLLITKVLATQ